jgi:hypothetical protein
MFLSPWMRTLLQVGQKNHAAKDPQKSRKIVKNDLLANLSIP